MDRETFFRKVSTLVLESIWFKDIEALKQEYCGSIYVIKYDNYSTVCEYVTLNKQEAEEELLRAKEAVKAANDQWEASYMYKRPPHEEASVVLLDLKNTFANSLLKMVLGK